VVELLSGDVSKRVAKIMTAIMMIALFVDLGIGIFAGNYFNIYHVLLPGYVPIKTISRYGGGTIYVAPWVANLHHYALWVFFMSFGGVLLLAAARFLAIKLAHAEVGD
jgi:hypothetical protein